MLPRCPYTNLSLIRGDPTEGRRRWRATEKAPERTLRDVSFASREEKNCKLAKDEGREQSPVATGLDRELKLTETARRAAPKSNYAGVDQESAKKIDDTVETQKSA